MTLTKAKLAELRRIRDGATQGSWSSCQGTKLVDWSYNDESAQSRGHLTGPTIHRAVPSAILFADTQYIAAFDPPTTGELLDAIEKMRDALTWANEMFEARDTMNAKVHCSPVRWSPVTERTRMALREVFGEDET